eukprot:5120679-Prymnesium_polylepis.1
MEKNIAATGGQQSPLTNLTERVVPHIARRGDVFGVFSQSFHTVKNTIVFLAPSLRSPSASAVAALPGLALHASPIAQ